MGKALVMEKGDSDTVNDKSSSKIFHVLTECRIILIIHCFL